jgi:hypothetical protein
MSGDGGIGERLRRKRDGQSDGDECEGEAHAGVGRSLSGGTWGLKWTA